MSPYRQPPPQPSAAPRAPWWRVAWAVVFRSLRWRLRERETRLFARAVCLAGLDFKAARWRVRDGNVEAVLPLPGPGRSVLM